MAFDRDGSHVAFAGRVPAVFDADGRRYVDGLASLWYCNVGHGRAEIVDAVTRQMRQIENYNLFDLFTNEPADRLADRVAALAPVDDARVFAHLHTVQKAACSNPVAPTITHSSPFLFVLDFAPFLL